MDNNSLYIYIKAKLTVRVETDGQEPSKIYEIMANAPKITSDEFPPLIAIIPLSQAPISMDVDGKTHYYYETKIKIKGSLRGKRFKETCSEFEAFLNYLNHEIKAQSVGRATISCCPFDGTGVPDDSKAAFVTYDIGHQSATCFDGH